MSIGYPDFGRQVQTQNGALFSVNQNVQGQTLSAIVYCGDTPYLEIQWDCTGLNDHYLVQLSFSDDAAGNTFAGVSNVVTTPLKTGWMSYKAKGQYVQLIINNGQNTDTSPIVITVRGTNWSAGPYDNASDAVPLIQFTGTIAASGTQTVTGITTRSGPATVYAGQGTAFAWQLNLDYWDWSSSSWIRLIEFHSTDTTGGTAELGTVNLPAAPVRVQYQNKSTASHTANCLVTV